MLVDVVGVVYDSLEGSVSEIGAERLIQPEALAAQRPEPGKRGDGGEEQQRYAPRRENRPGLPTPQGLYDGKLHQ